MPQVDAAVMIASKGYFWVTDFTGAGAGTKPTLAELQTFAADGTTVPTNWALLGHTDLDEVLAPGQDGGDITTKGSWQAPSLRQTQAAVVEFLDVKSLQLLDHTILSYYYGGGTFATANEFTGPATSTPVEKRLATVLVEGATVAGLYWPKCAIARGDALSFAADDFVKVPLRFTRLTQSGQPSFVWIADILGI